ncbi:hypothetical protein WJ68_15995 [Burkholderia ubonensis]|uniref:SWIM-type domain-containing protein n=2 Tax=Burkholderia ubonensis TaxID=101571 RepID=A0ABD4E1B4_9BURK|nr:hypothetical protein WJ68_15995 [Burkholderia ubonensis]
MARLPSARKEAEQNAKLDLDRRKAASTILNPNEVSGEYDGGRLLQTSLRGELRPITLDDLRAFQQNVSRLKKKFLGGITAQGVIDLALDADKQRANSEIRMAVPVSVRGPVFHFITNAGPDSDVSRHHVHVEFMDFDAAVGASPNDLKKIGKAVAKGRLKFNCDCGRHTYWYRYIATIGKYNYGRAETGFPKIRNPHLVGCACKHVLRVMHVILKDAKVQLKIAEQVIRKRDALEDKALKAERIKAADVREHAAEQQAKRRSSTNLKTTAQKAEEAAKRRARAAAKEVAVAKAKAEKPSANARKIERNARSLLALGAITQEQFNEIMKNAK